MYEDFFAERLAFLRTQKGVSARDMSLSLGYSLNYINMIENRRSRPSMDTFYNMCEYLGITPKEFFDAEAAYPLLLGAVIEDLKRLDEQTLLSVAGIVKGLAK